MALFLTASSLYSIFTQVPKTFYSIVALQEGFLKHLGEVATVLLDLVCQSLFCFFMSFQTDWMMIRSHLCVEHKNVTGLLQLMEKNNVWKHKLICPTDTLQ